MNVVNAAYLRHGIIANSICKHIRLSQKRVAFKWIYRGSSFSSTAKPVSQKNFVLLNSKRNFASIFEKKKPDYYKLDNIPKEYEIIYQAPMGNYIYWSQILTVGITVSTIVPIVGLSYAAYAEKKLYSTIYLQSPLEMCFAAVCLFATLYLVQNVVRRYALRIYYNSQKHDFIVIMPGLIPRNVKPMKCKEGDMKIIMKDSLNLLTLRGQYVVNGKRIILVEDNFRTPHYLNLMMGHDK